VGELLRAGVGLRGGTFHTRGYSDVFFRLNGIHWVDEVAVSGHAEWDRTTGLIHATSYSFLAP
jgi:hypothetical protein